MLHSFVNTHSGHIIQGYLCYTVGNTDADLKRRRKNEMGLLDFFKKTNINDGIRQYKETNGAVLLDVRSPEEYADGHIPESINLPLEQIMTAGQVLHNKDADIFSYCLRGTRSARAVKALRQMGYEKAVNIGGIAGYKGEITRK